MDIDMLRTRKADQATLLAPVKDCATLKVAADGLHFIANSAVAEEITKDSEQTGTRILMDARMDNVRLKIQIDFGVGDVMVPGPRMIEDPVFLGGNTIELLAYPIETAIAEKLQAMAALGNANSRMKVPCSKPSTRRSRIDERHSVECLRPQSYSPCERSAPSRATST